MVINITDVQLGILLQPLTKAETKENAISYLSSVPSVNSTFLNGMGLR